MTKYTRYVVQGYPYHVHEKSYGFFHLLFDFTLTILTCGLWLIWILIRYLRTNTR